jgi:hypothetical protein
LNCGSVAIDKGTAISVHRRLLGGVVSGDGTGDSPFDALTQADGRIARAVRIGVRSPEMPAALPAPSAAWSTGPGLAAC